MMANVKNIGSVIAELRKKKGVTQGDLAKAVGVSAQAVSKWENGGVPDVELLPDIADFFDISVDTLFGRTAGSVNITAAIFDHVRKTKPDSEERFKTVFELCWDMERSIFDFGNEPEKGGTIQENEACFRPDEQRYSSVLSDHGFTRMGIANRLQYFLFVPEIKDKQAGLLDGIDYTAFFKDFSDADVFNACVMLFKRNIHKAFTTNLLVKELNVDVEKALEILRVLAKYYLITTKKLELDDVTTEIYTFNPTPSFVSLLIFAREMIAPPDNFIFYSGGRGKPYLV